MDIQQMEFLSRSSTYNKAVAELRPALLNMTVLHDSPYFFLAHYVDYIASCPLKKLRDGQTRRSYAFEEFSSMCDAPVEEVKYDYKSTRLYSGLIAAEGLGILLEIGPNLSAM